MRSEYNGLHRDGDLAMRNLKTEMKRWRKKNEQPKKKAERESGGRFWREVMGMDRPTYKRRGGALRQK